MIQLRKWLDENTKSSEEALIELDGVFQARGAIEGGEKVFAIEPAGEIKILIKDDAAIENSIGSREFLRPNPLYFYGENL